MGMIGRAAGLAAAFVAGGVAVAHCMKSSTPRSVSQPVNQDASSAEQEQDEKILRQLTELTPQSRKTLGVKLRLRPNYTAFTKDALKKLWLQLSKGKRLEAMEILASRLNHRGRSYSGLQVLMALVAAVEAAIIVFSVDKGLLTMKSMVMGWSAITATVALIFLSLGILPLKNEVIPSHLEDEGANAIANSLDHGFGRFMELRGRSTHQRRVLWRSRVWFYFSVMATIFSLVMIITGIAQFMQRMPA